MRVGSQELRARTRECGSFKQSLTPCGGVKKLEAPCWECLYYDPTAFGSILGPHIYGNHPKGRGISLSMLKMQPYSLQVAGQLPPKRLSLAKLRPRTPAVLNPQPEGGLLRSVRPTWTSKVPKLLNFIPKERVER